MARNRTARALLGRTVLFRPLQGAARRDLVAQMRPVTFERGQAIYGRGERASELYLILDGRVRLSVVTPRGRRLSLRHACAGDVFGEVGALDGGLRAVEATALTRVRAMRLTRTELCRQISSDAKVARAAIKLLCLRARETSKLIEAIALHPVEVRLANYLLSLLKPSSSHPHPASIAITLEISQGALAQLLGSSRQKVNAALAALERYGAIKRLGNRLTSYPMELRRLAADLSPAHTPAQEAENADPRR